MEFMNFFGAKKPEQPSAERMKFALGDTKRREIEEQLEVLRIHAAQDGTIDDQRRIKELEQQLEDLRTHSERS